MIINKSLLYYINHKSFHFPQVKKQTLSGSSFSNVNLFHFSLLYLIVKECLWVLNWQSDKENILNVNLSSGKLFWAFFFSIANYRSTTKISCSSNEDTVYKMTCCQICLMSVFNAVTSTNEISFTFIALRWRKKSQRQTSQNLVEQNPNYLQTTDKSKIHFFVI